MRRVRISKRAHLEVEFAAKVVLVVSLQLVERVFKHMRAAHNQADWLRVLMSSARFLIASSEFASEEAALVLKVQNALGVLQQRAQRS
jgi:hypothetical protein